MPTRTINKQTSANEETIQPTQNTSAEPAKKSNDDLKNLIESLKKKIGTHNGAQPKRTPPPLKSKGTWNRSINNTTEWKATPAYNVLTRISNHEKVPTKSVKPKDQTIKNLPHSFLYRPGADGIKVDNIEVKAGKQMGWA